MAKKEELKVGDIIIATKANKDGTTTYLYTPVKLTYKDKTHYCVEHIKSDDTFDRKKGDRKIVAKAAGWHFKKAPQEIIEVYLTEK